MRHFSNHPTLDRHRHLQPLEALERDQETRPTQRDHKRSKTQIAVVIGLSKQNLLSPGFPSFSTAGQKQFHPRRGDYLHCKVCNW